MLGCDTDWRQGDLLTCESAAAAGLPGAADPGRRVIVITHDCDIRHDNEDRIEVIVAEVVAKTDSRFARAKNPRRLHLIYEGADAVPLILDLRHRDRHSVQKRLFTDRAVKDNRHALSDGSKRTLKQWLAARYGRVAFPDEFEKRLRKRCGSRTVADRIEEVLRLSEANHLVALYFDLGEQRGVEAAVGEPYSLSIAVVYDAIDGGAEAMRSAEQVAEKLRELFEKAYGKPDVATEIALDACEAVPDTHVTLADLRRVDQWRLEHISLDDGNQGVFLPVGEAPA